MVKDRPRSPKSGWTKLWSISVTGLLTLLMFLAVALVIALAGASQEYETSGAAEDSQRFSAYDYREGDYAANVLAVNRLSQPAGPAFETDAAVEVAIHSSPWATVDNTDVNTGPGVFVVEAVVTNTSGILLTDLTVHLDYDRAGTGWVLLDGEEPDRTIDLDAGEAYHLYWFARYPLVYDSGHRYTVTVYDNLGVILDSTSDNYYGNPAGDNTVMTRSTVSAANSGVTQVGADVVVGVAFTVTVDYLLGTNAQNAAFSPVGNTDFDPSAYRLLAAEVSLYDSGWGLLDKISDRLYIDSLPTDVANARATYTFIAVTPKDTRLCSYATVKYNNPKYDQFYCNEAKGTVISITGRVSLLMTKLASSPTIRQNQPLAYTIAYTNDGDLPLTYAWIWDDVNADLASIDAGSISPTPDIVTDSRVAWYLGNVSPGEHGTLSFAVQVDGDGQDISDSTSLVNHAFFGINPGSLPTNPALTSTVTTTVQAPTLLLSKTDGQATAETDDELVYTLHITNSGSSSATGVIVTDVLPAEVSYVPGSASPEETSVSPDGRTLVWKSPDIGDIPANDGTLVINVPVTVGLKVPNGTVLTNWITVEYANTAGWIFSTESAMDTTTVDAPVLTVAKSDFPDPVLTNHLITYTLEYANNGPADATNVVITDVVPANTTYQSCGLVPCGESGGVVSWTLGTVPEGGSGSVRFSVRVSSELETGELIENSDYGIVSDQTEFAAGPLETTRVSREAAFIDGHTFIDADGDGEYDVGEEEILPGIAITLTQALTPTTTTDAEGYYHFRVEIEGPIEVSAELPDGYFRTTPGTVVFLDTIFGITRTVDFGYAPITSTFGVIYGTVFEDTDHDGLQNLGESGLQGVTVKSAEAVTKSVTTNEHGQYTLRFDIGSTSPVTITEEDPPNHVSTTPNEVNTNAVPGSSGPSPIDFGDFKGIKITGQVFDDVNVNGANDGEAGVPDAVVTADGDSFTTGASGVYTLYTSVKNSDPILIIETDPDGYVSTNAVPGENMSRDDFNTLRIASPVSGTIYSGGDFGDVQAADVVTVTGQVWDDNGAGGGGLANGLLDGTEPGLPGAVISLSTGLTQTTGADGSFRLYGPSGVAIQVTETNPDGYASTNAIAGDAASKIDNDNLSVGPLSPSETSAGNLFGDVLASSVAIITGTVFDDDNENGVLNASELGLEGVTVTLDVDGSNSIVVTTDQAGQYQFAVPPGTDARLTSSGPGGAFYPTTPDSVVVRPPAIGVYPDNNFGYSDDADVAVIYGLVFHDLDGDGEQDFGELGLAGAVITLNGTDPITTTNDALIRGTFTFSVNQAGMYAIHEKNPPGYRSTTPDDLNVSVALGKGYFVVFGDTISEEMATIYGTVFDDLNGNGLQDGGEPGLHGVVISVTVGTGVLSETTGTYGQYSYGFDITEEGLHIVREQDPAKPGYRSTTPDEVRVLVALGSSYIVNFGDTQADTFSTIMGTVFNDISGDGVPDPGEPGISNVVISLSDGQTTTTNAYGNYTFATTETGAFVVTETDPDGYHSTTPNSVMVNVASLGQLYIVNFGDNNNPLLASFFGTVFEDQDANGAWDLAEPPLSGVPVAISDSASPLPTNQWGQFTFLIESAGTYTVTETDPTGYVSTIAIAGDPDAVTVVNHNTLRARVELGTDLGDNLFGDVLASTVITISGYVWDDNGAGGDGTGDGIWDELEPPLSGATVSLSSGTSQKTGSDGFFQLHALAGQEITVSEENPPGYVSTGAIPGNDATKIDDDTLLVAATLSAGEASTGNFFGDKLCTCAADMYEDDDTPSQATPIDFGLNNSQTHDFCDDAADWVKFTAQAYNVYTITTKSWGQRADTFLAVFDTDGETLLAANDDYKDATDFSSRMVWQAPADGVYYVRITNRAMLYGCDTDYDVKIEREEVFVLFLPVVTSNVVSPGVTEADGVDSPLGIINHSCPDDYEIDDTWQQAHSIDPGTTQTHSFDSNPAAFAADKDFVWFDVKPGQTTTFTVAPVINTKTLLELYDKGGDALDEKGTTQLVWTPTKGGRYFLSVSPLTTTFGCANQVGYGLLMEQVPVFDLFLPIVATGD